MYYKSTIYINQMYRIHYNRNYFTIEETAYKLERKLGKSIPT